ncbi:MAG: HesA/MoeB/ThiF family protein [Clostridia bacterium]|nr:HesA/MoeB/ThiF family protein [Clostridia bacterium]
MEERYSRNIGAISKVEIAALHTKRACVIGCGGLGGYVIELLSRVGIGFLTAVDGDAFVLSNLNRQLLSSEESLGQNKALAAMDRIALINSETVFNAIPCFVTEENAESIIQNHDIVIDALDNIPARRIVAENCDRLGIPLVHGAIDGWCAQISVIFPHSQTFEKIYPAKLINNKQPSALSFTPALAASIQAAETVKVLLGRPVTLQSRLLIADMLTQEYSTVKL